MLCLEQEQLALDQVSPQMANDGSEDLQQLSGTTSLARRVTLPTL